MKPIKRQLTNRCRGRCLIVAALIIAFILNPAPAIAFDAGESLYLNAVRPNSEVEPRSSSLKPSANDIERRSSYLTAASGSYSALSRIWPVTGEITSSYGWRWHPIYGDLRFHFGVDFGVDEGTPVRTPESGTVSDVSWSDGVGNVVEIAHGSGIFTRYCHLSQVYVGPGQSVSQGQVVAASGNTGYLTTGPHLHFEVYNYYDPTRTGDPYWSTIDPIGWLNEGDTGPNVTLINKYNGATLTTFYPTFRWNLKSGAVGYGVEILDAPPEPGEVNSPDPSIHRIAAYPTGGTSYTYDATGLTPGSTYYYRVIAWNSSYQFIGGHSDADSFVVSQFKVTLTDKYNGATLTTNYPLLRWNAAPGASGYGVEVLDAPPESGEVNRVTPSVHRIAAYPTGGTSYTLDATGLTPGQTYYYRVIAWNSSYQYLGGHSDADSFVRGADTPSVTLTNTYNGAILTTMYPVLRWNAAPGAVGYGVEILDAPPEPGEANKTAPSVHRIAAYPTGGTSYTLDATGLTPGRTYYYRVIAWNSSYQFIGGHSEADSFVRGTDTASVTLTDRYNGVTLATLYTVLRWNATPGAIGYGVEILNAAPEPGELNSVKPSVHRIAAYPTSGTSYTYNASGLTPGQTYYYRVIAWNASYQFLGGHSDADSFVFETPLSGTSLTSFIGGRTLDSPYVTFSWDQTQGAVGYGVEILDAMPEPDEVRGNGPSIHRVRAYSAGGELSSVFDARDLPAGLYYYRVIPWDGNYRFIGGYSNVDSFSTTPMPGVILTNTLNGSTLPSAFPVLSWESVPKAIGYGVEILDAPPEPGEAHNQNQSIHRVAAFPTGDNSYEYDSGGLLPGTYYYRVIAWNNQYQFIAGFSEHDSFVVPTSYGSATKTAVPD